MVVTLAHFSPALGNPLKMKSKDAYFWYNETVKFHEKLNKSDG